MTNSAAAVTTLARALEAAVDALEDDLDQVRRARTAETMIDLLRQAAREVGDQRTAALMGLRDEGWSLADMKAEFGIARARLSQIINRDDYRAQRRARKRS